MPDDEHDDGADDRAEEARALIRPVPADRLPEIGRDEGPDDADDRRHDEAARVVRRGGDGAGDQAATKPMMMIHRMLMAGSGRVGLRTNAWPASQFGQA